MVVCGELELYQKRNDTTTNPVLIVEEAKDRGDKMLAYRTLSSLKAYVLVSQDKALVEQFIKKQMKFGFTMQPLV